MKNNSIRDVSVAVILAVLLVAILNPLHLWMPTMVHMLMLAFGVALFGAYATFIMREETRDERDSLHKMRSGRNAFLVGATVLVVGIVYEGVIDAIDVWLVSALVAMIITKLISRWYSDRHH